MIGIALVYGCILLYEWKYLAARNRRRRTYFVVLGSLAAMFLGFEAIYVFKEKWALVNVVETVFGPIQKLLFMKQ
ncbi:hypothetical protein AV654_01490 [Paenibacillus elgii]|uniref:Uncharacterized protein n=1 Tax=Paenibacillus elgii TaxID=189691 RepID=A0A161U6K4_9BACL|nr:hypothetical protein [Paenibacillus elgii]KZE81196.1 hypothetical protein AV654_01490 [Paenibacillus elgii]